MPFSCNAWFIEQPDDDEQPWPDILIGVSQLLAAHGAKFRR